MGWPAPSTVCAAEGHRDGRQRGFTIDEVQRLAAIFGCKPRQLMTRCANCVGDRHGTRGPGAVRQRPGVHRPAPAPAGAGAGSFAAPSPNCAPGSSTPGRYRGRSCRGRARRDETGQAADRRLGRVQLRSSVAASADGTPSLRRLALSMSRDTLVRHWPKSLLKHSSRRSVLCHCLRVSRSPSSST